MDVNVEILLVENNASDKTLALHAFNKQDVANNIHVVRDGTEALEYVFRTGAYAERTSENPKLMLLNLHLPLLDGFEVLRRIRAQRRTQTIPVVILTRSSEERDIAESYRLGANSYIVMPPDFPQFLQVAQQLASYWLQLNRPATSGDESSFEDRPGSA